MTSTTTRRPLRIALLAIGSILLALAVALGAAQVVRAATTQDDSGTWTLDPDLTGVTIESSTAQVTVEAGAVDAPVLEFVEGDRDVRLERSESDGRLTVRVAEDRWGPSAWWSGSFDQGRIRLVVPADLEAVDLDIRTDAGRIDVAGDFGTVDLRTSAGAVTAEGSASELSAGSDVGSVRVEGMDVRGAVDLFSNVGEVVFATGVAPESVTARSDVGAVTLRLPDADFDLDLDADLGSVTSELDSVSGGTPVEARSSVGSVRVERR
jgi:hypothetical protein